MKVLLKSFEKSFNNPTTLKSIQTSLGIERLTSYDFHSFQPLLCNCKRMMNISIEQKSVKLRIPYRNYVSVYQIFNLPPYERKNFICDNHCEKGGSQ